MEAIQELACAQSTARDRLTASDGAQWRRFCLPGYNSGMNRPLGIIYGVPSLLRQAWRDRNGRVVLFGICLFLPSLIMWLISSGAAIIDSIPSWNVPSPHSASGTLVTALEIGVFGCAFAGAF